MSDPYRQPGSKTDCITQLVVDVLANEVKKIGDGKYLSKWVPLPVLSRDGSIDTLNTLLVPRLKVLNIRSRIPSFADCYLILVRGPGG